MGTLYSQYTYDNALLLKAAGAVAATTNHPVLDVGPGLFEGDLVIDVVSVESDSANEIFTLSVEASNVAAMDSGSVCTAKKVFGQLVVPMDAALTAPGRYVIPFRNEENGVIFRYIRLHTLVAGTIATGISFTAFIGKR